MRTTRSGGSALRALLAVLAASAAGLALLSGSAPAVASGAGSDLLPVTLPYSFTAVSEGDSVGASRTALMDERSSELEASASGDAVTLLFEDASSYWRLEFSLPRGDGPLRPGFHAVSGGPTGPRMDIASDSRGCTRESGHFDLRDLQRTGNRLDRLWLLYEIHCDGSDRSLFGEIRVGVPVPSVRVAPGAVRWPDRTYAGEQGWTVPVQVTLGEETVSDVVSVGLVGRGRDQYDVVLDECTGRLVGDTGCLVWLRFAPVDDGPQAAVLRVESAWASARVRLDGATVPGVTGWHTDSDPGDFVGQGTSRHFDTTTDSVVFRGTRRVVTSTVVRADGERWTASLAAPEGAVLAPGTYRGADRYPFHGSGAGLSVAGAGRDCTVLSGAFTIHDIGFAGGRLQRLDAQFVQHCEGEAAALHGRLELGARADRQAPAAVTGVETNAGPEGLEVSWSRPDTDDVAGYSVRWYPGVASPPLLPTAGLPAFDGARTTFVLRAAPDDRPVTLAVFGHDAEGNVSQPAVVVVPPAA